MPSTNTLIELVATHPAEEPHQSAENPSLCCQSLASISFIMATDSALWLRNLRANNAPRSLALASTDIVSLPPKQIVSVASFPCCSETGQR
jgi:hypothetical protein